MPFGDKKGAATHAPYRIAHHPDLHKIRRLLIQTGYSLEVTCGQRKYGDPPANSVPIDNVPVDHATVFCGGFPNNIFEDTLVPLFEICGVIWELRIMLDKETGINKGYGFITYTTEVAAERAVEILNGFTISSSAQLTVSKCIPNNRLFVGNIPKNKSKQQLKKFFGRSTEGLKGIRTYGYSNDAVQNRGFCFLEYESHETASFAKNRLSNDKFRVWGHYVTVNWADQRDQLDTHIMHKSKIIFLRNIPPTMSEFALRNIFKKYGRIIRIKKSCQTSAIVHFANRCDALCALDDLKEKFMRDFDIELIIAISPLDNTVNWSNEPIESEVSDNTGNRHSAEENYNKMKTPAVTQTERYVANEQQAIESSLMVKQEGGGTQSFARTTTYNYDNYGYQFHYENTYYGQRYNNNGKRYYYEYHECTYQTHFPPDRLMASPGFHMHSCKNLPLAKQKPCRSGPYLYITMPIEGYHVNNRYFCSCGCELREIQTFLY